MTNDDNSQGWRLSSQLVNQTNSLSGSTLDPFYQQSYSSDSNLNYIFYNDQPPNGETRENYGHSKGAIGFNLTIGFWLVHSVPHFPPLTSSKKYDYPDTGKNNGQSFLCITFDVKSQLSSIIDQLLYIKPYVYDFHIDNQTKSEYNILIQLMKQLWHKNGSNDVKLTSLAGTTFLSFSKSPADNVDIYTDIVSVKVKNELFVETWRKGDGEPLPSNCSAKYKIKNVQKISIHLYGNQSLKWKYLEDHSKWAIGVEDHHPLTCVGDMNRMKSQYKRGGGLVCFSNKQVWNTYLASIKELENCKKKKAMSLYDAFKLIVTEIKEKIKKALSPTNYAYTKYADPNLNMSNDHWS